MYLQMVAETISLMIDDPDKRLDCHVLDQEKDKELLKLRDLIYAKDAVQQHDEGIYVFGYVFANATISC